MNGFSQKTVRSWLAVGFRVIDDGGAVRPADPEKKVEVGSGQWYTEGEWYKHEVECRALALVVMTTQGKLVSSLVTRMWKNAGKNPDMMKFLFKAYAPVHGLEDKAQDTDKAEAAAEDNVQIQLPDNGRMLVQQ